MNVFKKEDSQALKGIAILLMMFHHCFRSTSLFEKYTVSFFPFSEGEVVNLALMSKICVALFAFISGYGLFLSYDRRRTTASRWAASRYIKTFSGFWFIYVLLAAANIIVGNRFAKVYFGEGPWVGIASVLLDFAGLAKLFGTGTLIGTWWYMSAAIVFIILIPLLYKPIRDKTWIVLVASTLFLRVILVRVEAGTFTGNNSIYAFIPALLAGALFAREDIFNKWIKIGNKRGTTKAIKFVVEMLLLFAFGLFYTKLPLDTFWEFKFCIGPVAFIMFCVEFILPFRFIHRILGFFGKHSMNIFLIHTFIRAGYLSDFTYSWKHFALIVIMLFAVSLIISIIVEYVKKITKYNTFMERFVARIEYSEKRVEN